MDQDRALLFTDLTDSTSLYSSVGDAKAFRVVQEHFDLLSKVIAEQRGTIVKTIGDAVMASFPVNADAVRAARRIQRDFDALGDRLSGIEVKIGLHRGPTICVTSNRTLDYFGRTVNVAARAQGAAKPREVLLTESVLSDPAALGYLRDAGFATERFEARVKGVSAPLVLHSVRAA